MTFVTIYKNVSISELSGIVNMKRGINILSQEGILNAEALTTMPGVFASFMEEAAKGAVQCQLKGLRTSNGVDWINSIVKSIDQPVTLPLQTL